MARTDAQIRAAAQRKLARELKAGTFKPSAIGKKAREAAKKLTDEKETLIKAIIEYKRKIYGKQGKYNPRHSDRNVRVNPRTHKARPIEQLRTIVEVIEQITDEQAEDEFYWAWDDFFGDDDYESTFFYH
jgi:hypothetical protein